MMDGLDMMGNFLDMAAKYPRAHELMIVLLTNGMTPGDKNGDILAAVVFKSVSLGIALAGAAVGGLLPQSTRKLALVLEDADRKLRGFHEGASR